VSDAILHVVGARPNFMKVAPVWHALQAQNAAQMLVHTGQHYDVSMSDVFFRALDLPDPDINLEVGSGTHAVQTAAIMTSLEPIIDARRPRTVLVYGDVNSTLAAALVCAKARVSLAHVEAGLRSGDRRMPEEINRLVTDRLAQVLYTPSSDADQNLIAEGVEPDRIHFVGNVMIDTLVRLLPAARERWQQIWSPQCQQPFGLVTLHRPATVDDPDRLLNVVNTLIAASRSLPLLFSVHPRTRRALASLAIEVPPTLTLLEPLGYIDFLALQQHARLVITDSGGIQEETTYLGVPCITVRDTTERPVTLTLGTNTLVGHDMTALRREIERVLGGDLRKGSVPPLWDGCAGERIASHLLQLSA